MAMVSPMLKSACCLPALCAAILVLGGCAAPSSVPTPSKADLPDDQASLQKSLGIAVHGLHVSAHGYILDLRYRVIDPVKAAVLLEPGNKVQLLDARRGATLGIPESPVIGPMRQTSRNHVIYRDRDYFVLFANPGSAVKPGDMVRLAVDGRALARLRVE
jgi:hypothetical protein